MNWRPFRQVRARLTAWYVAVLAAVLGVFIVGTAGVMFTQMRGELGRYIVQDLETIEGLLWFDPDGGLHVREDYHNHPESRFVLERYFEVRTLDGAVLYKSPRLGTLDIGGLPFAGEGEGGYSNRRARLANGTRILVVSRRHAIDGRPVMMRLAYSLEPVWQRVHDWIIDTVWSLSVALLLAAFAGYRLARRTLKPIDAMADRVEAMTATRLQDRLPTGGPDDELAHLTRVFNQLLDRVEQSFEQLRRFTADASHELRTPLASLRSVGEVGLQGDATSAQYREVIGSMLEEVNHLTALVDQLLQIARADQEAIAFEHRPVHLLRLVEEATGIVDVLLEEKGQHLVVSGDADAVVVGDPVFLRQALVNVVHNAVKYSPVGGTIRVSVGRTGDRASVDVADSGPGIPKEHLSKVFDRFYRVDRGRSREAGGTGLGLSIAKWAIEAHEGTIQMESEPGKGSTVHLTLPVLAS